MVVSWELSVGGGLWGVKCGWWSLGDGASGVASGRVGREGQGPQHTCLARGALQESCRTVLKQETETQVYRWKITSKKNENQTLGGRDAERSSFLLFCAVLSHFSGVRLFATPWTVVCQSPLSMGCSRQACWSGCRALQGLFATQGLNPGLLVSCTGRWVLYH